MSRTKMKASEFYSKLSELLEKGFKLTRSTIQDPEAEIRLYKSDIHKSFCPITAVVYSETGKYFNEDNVVTANKYLGLHYDVREAIVDGADNETDNKRTRIKLKKALGLIHV